MTSLARRLEVEVGASPFREAGTWFAPIGSSCAWLVENAPDLVTRDPEHVVVLIGGEDVPHGMWARVKPKPCATVSVLVVPRGDDGFAFAQTALQITSAFAGFVNPLAGLALAVGGGLILEAFRPGPKGPGSVEPEGLTANPDNSAGSSTNQLRPDAQIPAVAGEHRVTLALLAPAYVDIVGDKEVVFLIAGLQGATDLNDFEINEAPIEDFSESVMFNANNGLSGTGPDLTIYDRIVIQEAVNERFELYETVPDAASSANDYRELVDQSNPTTSRPKRKIRTSSTAPDEIWLHFALPDGIKSNSGDPTGTAFTIEIRRKGETEWRKLPYIRMISAIGIERRYLFYVKLIFAADPGGLMTNIGEPWDEILSSAFTNNDAADGGNQDWTADSWFDNGADDQAAHVAEFVDGLEIYLDPDDPTDPWPRDQYEIRIDKGFTISQNNLQSTLQGQALYTNVFDSAGTLIVPNISATNQMVSNLEWTRIASVYDETPVTAPNLAYIELRGEAVRIERLTALAAGYTNVFNGTDWNAVAQTSDPAAWYRRALIDIYHARPLPEALLDDAALQAWSLDNAAKGICVQRRDRGRGRGRGHAGPDRAGRSREDAEIGQMGCVGRPGPVGRSPGHGADAGEHQRAAGRKSARVHTGRAAHHVPRPGERVPGRRGAGRQHRGRGDRRHDCRSSGRRQDRQDIASRGHDLGPQAAARAPGTRRPARAHRPGPLRSRQSAATWSAPVTTCWPRRSVSRWWSRCSTTGQATRPG